MNQGLSSGSLLSEVAKMEDKPFPEIREAVADKVSSYYNESAFEEDEKQIACEILRLLARDVEVRVRKVIAENLKQCDELPHDVAVKLANDVLEIAEPILEFSHVLTDDDLKQIIRSTNEIARLNAISRRDNVSPGVSAELINKEESEVVVSLFSNQNATIPEVFIEKVLEHFEQNGRVVEAMIFRGGLPIGVVEKMLTFVTGHLKQKLIKEYNISEQVADKASDEAREAATLGLLKQGQGDPAKIDLGNAKVEQKQEEANTVQQQQVEADAIQQPIDISGRKHIEQLVEHLYRNDRLTTSIVIRALCEGNIDFFEVGIAKLAGIPYANAHMLLWDNNIKAFHSLYQRADMPQSAQEAVSIIVDLTKGEIRRGSQVGPSFSKRIVEMIVENGYDNSVPLMPYMMALIGSQLKTGDIVSGL